MPGEGQFVNPVQVEVTSNIGADVTIDGTAPPGTDLRGLAIMGYYPVGNQLFVPRVDAAGNLVVSAGGVGVQLVAGSPGTIITTPADTAVGIGATVALPAIPAGTRRFTVQVTVGDAATRIRVREVGAGAGRGKILDFLGSTVYGGLDGAVAALEVENVAGPISAVMVQFERT